ncbi:MAG: hypothetical protein ACXWCY_20500 [Burkholderiales bacterium]
MNLHPEDSSILIVQRDAISCDEVSVSLSTYRTVATSSCAHALDLSRVHVFDLYVFDTELSDGDLKVLCSGIRQLDPNAPIVAYSDSIRATGADALICGANVLLRRPADGPMLAHTVSGLLDLAKARIASAWHAEYLALQESMLEQLNLHQTTVAETLDRHARWSALCNTLVRDNALRLRASNAFLRCGGTRANFARAWPQLVEELNQTGAQTLLH